MTEVCSETLEIPDDYSELKQLYVESKTWRLSNFAFIGPFREFNCRTMHKVCLDSENP
jgi:hypothetical protein